MATGEDLSRAFPFTHVRLHTVVSPEITRGAFGSFGSDQVFWPLTNGQDVKWSLTGIDHEGRAVDFVTALPFAFALQPGTTQEIAYEPFVMAGARATYEASGARRVAEIGGQRVSFVPSTVPGDTAFPTRSFVQNLHYIAGNPDVFEAADEPAFFPWIQEATVDLTAVSALQGGPLGAPPRIEYDAAYVAEGFGPANAGEVFAKILGTPPRPDVPLDRAGGLASPNFDVTGLSRSLGPVGGDLTKLASPTPQFDAVSVFQGLLPKLFGEIALTDLLPVVPLSLPGDAAKLPQVTTELVFPGGDRTKAPKGLLAELLWRPRVQDSPGGVLAFLPADGQPKDGKADLTAKFSVPLADPAFPNTYEILGELRDFQVLLLGTANPFIKLTFARARFTAKTAAKPSLDVALDKVEFVGPLTFVNELKDYLQSGGKGPRVDIQPSGIKVDYTLQLPSIGIGVFSLQNVALSTGLGLPFDGTPAYVDFAVCSRNRPFLLTMGLFGGGGFFGLSLTMNGLRQIEASIEFGAAVQLNLGVASGGVSIMAGIYFRLSTKPTPTPHNEIELTGYLRACGSLEVLGIITITVELYLGFTYLDPGKAYGKASVSVTVEILFFSASVTLTVERKIGGGSDPTFLDNVPTQAVWDTYCDAFA
jgi:hypothetical protein